MYIFDVQNLHYDFDAEQHDRIHTKVRAGRMLEGCICVTYKNIIVNIELIMMI